jgi:PKD domain
VLAVPASAGAAPSAAPFQVSVSYAPSTSDPLLVTFFATVVPGTPTLFNWSFGDGHYFNGSGPAFLTPVHHYPPGGGTFTVTVTVHEGTEVNGTSLGLTLVPARLSVAPSAAPAAGAAPLTVSFQANVVGGSGTYRTLIWSFGTGDQGSGLSVPYTFTVPGRYVVEVNVTDSAGVSALGRVEVNVTGNAPAAVAGSLPAQAAMIGAGAAAGAGAGAAAMFFWQRRPGRPRVVAVPAGPPPPPPTGSEPARGGTPGPSPPPATVGDRPAAPVRPASPEAFRISHRVVVHLSLQGLLGPHDVATLGFTQPGISKALGIRQNALTNVLRRLVAAGVIVEDVRHVQGQPRRLKVYQLTPRGEALARELRHPRPPPDAG